MLVALQIADNLRLLGDPELIIRNYLLGGLLNKYIYLSINGIPMISNSSKGAALYERAKKVLPGGCSRNTVLRKPHPLYAEKGHAHPEVAA